MRRPLRAPLLACAALLGAASLALAADPAPAKKKSGAKVTVPKIEMPTFGEIPKAEGLVAPKAEKLSNDPQVTTTRATYEVVKVQHARDFSKSGDRAQPVGLLEAIALSGKPPTLEKFTTLVRVKSPQKVSTEIELVILDPRGDTALSGGGELSYRGAKGDEVDYLIDWAPVARPAGGEYKLLVRIGGEPMGTWPMKVVARK
jgi:hypothetical protein